MRQRSQRLRRQHRRRSQRGLSRAFPLRVPLEAAAAAAKSVSFQKIIHSPINFRTMQVVDRDTIITTFTAKNVLTVAWLCPMRQLQQLIHKRFEVEVVATDEETKEGLGILIMVAGRRVPEVHGSWFNRQFLCKPHDVVNFQALVVDRFHWKRTMWNLGSFCTSLAWAQIPRYAYGITSINASHNIRVTADLNRDANRNGSYECNVDGVFTLKAKESAYNLFDADADLTPGFTDNESALNVLGLPRESLSFGVGGFVNRQPAWTPLFNPTLAGGVSVELTPQSDAVLGEMIGGPLPLNRPPLAAWLMDELDECLVFTPEADIESENDPSQYGTGQLGERGVNMRVTTRAVARSRSFASELRSKAYGAAEGRVPR
jgi:hypothetical protein